MADLASINNGIVSSITGGITVNGVLNVLGWVLFAVIFIGGFCWFYFIWWRNKKTFTKKITAFEIVGQYWTPTIRDVAKTVKLGKGGFEILYLKKGKTWRIAYGGRVGKDTYYFYIMPDGYWYNGMMSANMNKIDKDGGLIPIVTTNPLMRGQYTALEKQVDAFAAEKKSFWESNKTWIIALIFIIMVGLFGYLIIKEYGTVTGQLSGAISSMKDVLNSLNNLATNVKGATSTSGLTPAT